MAQKKTGESTAETTADVNADANAEANAEANADVNAEAEVKASFDSEKTYRVKKLYAGKIDGKVCSFTPGVNYKLSEKQWKVLSSGDGVEEVAAK